MATKTIGLTGRDYSTLAAWCSYVNALSLSASEIGEVYNDGEIADTAPCSLTGYTGSSGSNQVILRPATGQGFKDHASAATNPLRYDASKGAAFTNNLGASASGCYRFDGGNIVVDGLQFKNTVATSQTCRVALATGSTFKNSIIDSTSSYAGVKMDSAANLFENLAVIQRDAAGTGIQFSGTGTNSTAIARGCTAINVSGSSSASGLTANSGTPTVINTAIYGFNSSFDGGSSYHASNCTNNATSQSSFTATNCNPSGQVSITSADFINVTSGAADLRPASTSTKLVNTGATSGLGTDVFGIMRPQGANYDIGAAEYVAPASILAGEAVLAGITAAGSMETAPDSSLSGEAVLGGITADGGMGLAPGVITTPVLKNNTGTILASVASIVANVYHPTTGVLVVRKTGLSSDGSGIVSITDALIVAGTTYAYEIDLSATAQGRRLPTGVAA